MKAVIFLSFLLFASVNTSFAQAVDTDKIYIAVEQKPEFPGGEKALLTYLAENVAIYNKEESCYSVFVQFIVEKDGSISNLKILRCEKLGTHFKKALETMPHFKPGMQNGQPVRVQYNLPLHIRLED